MARKRSTSVAHAAKNVQNAFKDLVPPELAGELSPRELEMFHLYSKAKAKADWFPHELYQLARLVKLVIELEDKTDELRNENSAVENKVIGTCMSGLAKYCASLQGQMLALTRLLNISSSQSQKKDQTTPRAKKEMEARNNIKPTSLLAVPNR